MEMKDHRIYYLEKEKDGCMKMISDLRL